MNSATSNLNYRAPCFNALAAIGGPDFEQACKPHTNVQIGTVITTTGGDLKCKWVVHAVGCSWIQGEEGPEKVSFVGPHVLYRCL